jgi:hypothetical protein
MHIIVCILLFLSWFVIGNLEKLLRHEIIGRHLLNNNL